MNGCSWPLIAAVLTCSKQCAPGLPSGVTAKPANGGHFKTGQRKWPRTRLFYSDAS
jgi:hypothetical protein